jgi:hypothetical protein
MINGRQRDRLRELARSRVSVRVTNKTRSSTGYEVLVNGELVHQCPSHTEAVNHLRARLECAPRLRIEVRPARKEDLR